MNKKVLICTSHFYPNVGGVETHLTDLVSALRRRDWRVYVATYKPLAREVPAPLYERKGTLQIYRMPWPGFNIVHFLTPYPPLEFLYLFPGLFLINLLVLLKNPDISIIHSQGLVPGVVGFVLAKMFGKKIVVSTHNLYFFPKYGLYKSFSRAALSQVDGVLALSSQSAKEIESLGVPKHKIKPFRYWLDLSLFKPSKKKSASTRALTVFFVGRLIETKGVKVLLSAAVDKRLKRVNFIFAGLGPLEAEVKKASKKYPNISYLGPLNSEEVKTNMNLADIAAIPSTVDEGYGRVAMEAISCGTPVLAGKKGGLREVVTDKVAWFAKPTPKDFTERLVYLTKHKGEISQKARNTRKYAIKRFSEKNVETIIKAYKGQA